MEKPIIGVMSLVDEEKDSLWMLPGYFDGIIEAGGIPVMLPLIEDMESVKQIANSFDGFVFSGGPDVDPKYYNKDDEVGNLRLCPQRDSFEMALIKEVIELDKPILGICRGLQLINVSLGGTLYQDLPKQFESEIVHSQERPYDVGSHIVTMVKGSKFYDLVCNSTYEEPNYYNNDGETLSVNSCHHQGIKDLAECLVPMANAADGLVEAFEMPEKRFLWAFQWHPEFMHKKDQVSRSIFKTFVDSCH